MSEVYLDTDEDLKKSLDQTIMLAVESRSKAWMHITFAIIFACLICSYIFVIYMGGYKTIIPGDASVEYLFPILSVVIYLMIHAFRASRSASRLTKFIYKSENLKRMVHS